MKKSSIVKAVLCGGAALTILAKVNAPEVSATALDAEKGLAGISITLDKYCAAGDTTEDVTGLETVTGSAIKDVVVTGAAVEEASQYDDIGISIANEYVNIRKEPSTEGEVIGKLYKGAAATIMDNNGEWLKIKSGNCTGYINSEFLATGMKAEELADTYGKKLATVTATTLKVREKKSTESACVTLVPVGETYEVLKEENPWVKISIDNGDVKGYVSEDYVDVRVEFEQAISIEEEKEKLRKEEEAKKAAEEAKKAEEAARAEATRQKQVQSRSNSGSVSAGNSTKKTVTNTKKKTTSDTSSSTTVKGSGTGADVAKYALKFVGNPYKYGGTSLTKGTDCSGFTKSVYAHFGITLNRVSRDQAKQGTKVSVSKAKAGDLVFYGSGSRISHVALCIGGGKVVHASNEKYGIRTSNIGYRKVITVRRILK